MGYVSKAPTAGKKKENLATLTSAASRLVVLDERELSFPFFFNTCLHCNDFVRVTLMEILKIIPLRTNFVKEYYYYILMLWLRIAGFLCTKGVV